MLRADHDPKIDYDREQDADNNAGHHAGDQQFANRCLGGDAVDHHGDAGWDQDVEGGTDTNCAGREFVGITMTAHFRHRDLGHHRGGGDARPGHRAEDAAGEHGGDGKTAADMRQPVRGGGVEVAGEPTRRREIRHQDEHRDGGQGIVGDGAERRQADDANDLVEVPGDDEDAEHAGACERDRDRHAEQQR